MAPSDGGYWRRVSVIWQDYTLRGTEDISDKRLLIALEQGLGDFIQFCRYVPLLLGRTSEVILEVPKDSSASD